MLLMGGGGGGVAATFIQILKTVVPIGDVALDKSVPTPLPLRLYLRHINHHLYIFISSE